MKTAVSKSDFIDAFRAYGRENQFSYNGFCALFDWYEELEAGTGEDIELDVIAICCDWSEAGSAVEWCEDSGYSPDYSGCDGDDEKEDVAREFLYDNTQAILFDGGFLAISF